MNLHMIPWLAGQDNTWVYDGAEHVGTIFRSLDTYEVFARSGPGRTYEFVGQVSSDEEALRALYAHFVWTRISE